MNRVGRVCVLMSLLLPQTGVAHAEPSEWPMVGVNTTVQDGGLQFRVYIALAGKTNPPSPVAEPNDPVAQGMYLSVSFVVTNLTSYPQTYNASYQRLIDKYGRVFAPDTAAMLSVREPVILTINPGNSAPNNPAFDVPAGTAITDYALVLHGSPSSPGANVRFCDHRTRLERAATLPPPDVDRNAC